MGKKVSRKMGEIYEDEKKEQVAENKGGWGLKMEEK